MPTVSSILESARLATHSLTPGIGEQRRVTWAHVCELPEPWVWLGDGALLMTTGIAIPAAAEEQCRYVDGLHRAGIAALAIGEDMHAPPITARMLARATELGFPILMTKRDTPFVTLSMAVAEAQFQERQERLQLTERLYSTLSAHVGASDFDGLLADLSELLGGTLRFEPPAPSGGAYGVGRGKIIANGGGDYSLPLIPPDSGALRLRLPRDATPDYSVLRHAAAIVSGVLSTHVAARRQRQLHGSILLGNIFDGAITGPTATALVAGYGIEPPYVLAACESTVGAEGIDRTDIRLEAEGIPSLLTEKAGFLYLLGTDTAELEQALAELAPQDGPTALSAPFTELGRLVEAMRRTRTLVAEAKVTGVTMIRQREHDASLPFVPSESDARQELVHRTLGVLLDYDAAGHSSDLVDTLHVFLAANRSWVRAAERLYLHRQTLVSRIARIEQLTGFRINSMQDSATLWFALQAAVAEGLIEPVSPLPEQD